MSDSKKDWLIAIGYVGFIYATLGVVRTPVSYLRSHGLLRLSLGFLYLACVVSLLLLMIRNQESSPWRYAMLCSICFTYFLVGKHVNTPEEQIHFFQYGLVGVFFARAVSHHTKPYWKIFLAALILATLAGWIDERLQGLLPNRHYDIRDVYLNFVSAFLGLIVYGSLFPAGRRLKQLM